MSKPRTFNIDEPFVARGGLMWIGVHYEEGASFDWRALGLDPRAVWDLWRSFMIDNASFASAPDVAAPTASNPAPVTPTEVPPPPPPAKPSRAERRAARS